MFRKPTFETCLEQLGQTLLEAPTIKAVMMSKNEDGDVVITLVEGTEESHKVKFGRLDRKSRTLSRHRTTRPLSGGNSGHEAVAG